jgi:methyl-accepting chemotaxis protein
VTQQNAANAEESASASEEMNAQAESMREFVNELAALVGGAGSHNTPNTAKPLPKAMRPVAAMPQVRAKPLAASRQGEVRPDQVIPFDEDEFTDF